MHAVRNYWYDNKINNFNSNEQAFSGRVRDVGRQIVASPHSLIMRPVYCFFAVFCDFNLPTEVVDSVFNYSKIDR